MKTLLSHGLHSFQIKSLAMDRASMEIAAAHVADKPAVGKIPTRFRCLNQK
ncbi:hypothetical protein [Cupriavidus pauculus]|uniref:hypothetical protein n=1 Tax=Cupriavidus pauculus TaxID=82633 RepID=UPI001EE2DEA1|nr:hypothetical protein [Cupriavidus pauculus]GJG95354.1 hypothetical protein CBA19C6_12715 [Cupriavidus pauculus]